MNTLENAKKQHMAGNLVEAYRFYRQSTCENSYTPEAWRQMSEALIASNKPELAVLCLRRLLYIEESWEAHLLLGQSLIKLGKNSEAQNHLKIAAKLSPRNSMSWYTLAYNSMMINELNTSKDAIDKAIGLDPTVADFEYLLSCLYLFKADWKNGFSHYESRMLIRPPSWDNMPEPYWKGEDLSGKSLHLFCEQGFGDIIQFLRFLELLPKDCTILFLVPKEMRRLLDHNFSFSNITMYNHGTKPPFNCDYKLPLCGIPKYFLNGNITGKPYLKTLDTAQKINKPKNIKRNIGIVWQGDPKHQNDKYRSAKIEDFIVELALPDVELYSLQIGNLELDTSLLGNMGLVQDLSPFIRDFSDTADLIKQLDMVITVDTSVSHLCGALGVPAHVMIPYGAVDWRWQHDTETCIWYDSLMLWRQKEGETWRQVLQRIANHIKKDIGLI